MNPYYVAKQKKDSFQIIPVNHDTLGIVYKLMENNVNHGTYGSLKTAEKSKLAIMQTRDTLKAIRDTENVEFTVDL
jgi:hypothetical protein